MTAERSEVRDVHANPDGTFTAELSTVPVRVKRGSGWVPVDTTLRRRADGGVEPAAATAPVVFSGGGDQPLARLGQSDAHIELRWPAPLPKPVLNGGAATYPEVLPGVDLRMAATAQGFTEVLVIKDRAAAANPKLAELNFGLHANGAKIRDDGHGKIGAYDAKGKPVFVSGAPMAWDSSPDAKRAAGEFLLGKDSLILRPGQALLADTNTRFPVEVRADFPAGRTGFALVFSNHPRDPYWGGDGQNLAKVGYCDWPYCNNIGVARSYFRFDAAFLLGRHVLNAEFNIFENYAPSCNARDVEAWGTNAIHEGTTWENQPFPGGGPVHLGTANVAHGYNAGCPGKSIGFNATAAVNNGVAFGGGHFSIMLKARDEGDRFAWKKFNTDPSVSVTYNSYPHAPTGQTVENKGCAVQPDEPHINPYIGNDPNLGPRGPQMAAFVTDPDGGHVAAQFEWYTRFGARLGTVTTAGKLSGASFTADVPAADAVDGAKLAYRVRGVDGIDAGPWGPWCDVTIDRTAPRAAPKVSSVTYPECEPPDYDPCDAGGSVGFTGGFAFAPNGETDVAQYQYYVYGQEGVFYARAGSGTANALVTPPDDGSLDLYVRSIDRAGNVGPEYRYHFWVGRGTPPKGHWKLEGSSEMKAVDDSPNGHHATPEASTRWQIGRHGDALWMNGTTGYAATAGGPTVETDKSFSVSAWVRLDRLDTTFRTAVSQDATAISGFFLQYNPAGKKWNFMMPAAHDNDAVRHIAESPATAVAGRWTHLVGLYDAGARQIKIYVDGVAGQPADHTTPWNATGAVQLGRAQWRGGPVDHWPGALDEVRIYDRVLAAEEIHDLAGAPAVEEAFLPLDEGTGTTAQEVSGNYRIATLSGATSWTAGKVGTGAVRFNGGDAALATTGPVIRTDAGFTVTAWARLDETGDQWRTILSQDGTQASGFQLRYRADTRKWSFALAQSDTGDGDMVSVDSSGPARAGEWTHLTGVYDAADARLRLYVNSAFEGSVPMTAKWNATGAFQVGRGKVNGAAATPFTGVIDDVHAWTGVRTQDQIRDEYRDQPVTRQTNHYGRQLGRFYNLAGHHIVTSGQVPPGSHFEFSLGLLAPQGAPDTRVIYSCRSGATDYFLSPDCGTHTNLGSVGRLYSTPPAGVPTLQVYRCAISGGGHFASTDPGCEGRTTEFSLGHTRAYTHLIRHVTSGYPYDHASSTARIERNYRPEGNYGTVAMFQLPGTTALMNCRDGLDTFTSADPACEGKTVVRRLGYIWTAPPQGVPGAPGAVGAELFRCRASWGDLFDSRDRDCEGQELDRSLGFVGTGL
ncbi:LamG-like jellyroll fold domain-containing protein [Nonomuraea solani]|uniref:LamG-like jellyroll fold domain-containing protein n=1 Tax=Nonomuraea solani TaxID=1144553 RepID=UPI001358C14C|nr:LamG-like jellyroll fold domain-containing protein [Nonomuraea solani]